MCTCALSDVMHFQFKKERKIGVKKEGSFCHFCKVRQKLKNMHYWLSFVQKCVVLGGIGGQEREMRRYKVTWRSSSCAWGSTWLLHEEHGCHKPADGSHGSPGLIVDLPSSLAFDH